MMDLKFRHDLKVLLEQDDDKKIIRFVLDHIVSQWPTSFAFWLARMQRDYDFL